MPKITKRFSRLFKTTPAKIAGLVAVAVILLAALEVLDITHILHKSAVPPVIPESSNQPDQQNTEQTSSSPSDSTDGQPSAKSNNGSAKPTYNTPLKTPYGQFVSNHYPGSDDSPTTENSVCTTTPGASCYIRFVNGSTVTGLPPKTTNSDGFASWNWDIKDAKLTKGSWKITAVATLNGQTKTADDPLPLTIK